MRCCDFGSEILQKWACRTALLSMLLMFISRLTFPDPDMFHQMALARESLRLGYVPEKDLFAYTPTVTPAIHHEWGTGALLYALLVAGGAGATGLICFKYLLTAAVIVGCFIVARRNGAIDPLLLPLASVAVLIGWIGFTTIRAQLLTLCFVTLLLWFLSEDRRGRRSWVFGWLALFVVWLNLHGGVVAGAGLFAFHAAERFARSLIDHRSLRKAVVETRYLWLAMLAMGPLALINPYGTTHAPLLFEAIRLERPLIVEWRPIWQLPEPTATLSVYCLSIAAIMYAVIARGWRPLVGLPLVLVTAYLAATHVRHASIYAVVWICYVPGYLQGTRISRSIEELWHDRRRLVTSGAVCVSIACLSVAVGNRFWTLSLPTVPVGTPVTFPAGAVDYLAETGFRGNVMTPFRAGAYVSWRLYPAVKVSFDGRYEAAYPPNAIAENYDFYKAAGEWRTTLTKYATDAVIVPRESELDSQLGSVPGWMLVYRDDGYSIFAAADVADGFSPINREGQTIVMQFP